MPSPDTAEKAKVAAGDIGESYTKQEALRMRGWIQTFDRIMFGIILSVLVVLMFWRIFGNPTALNLIACILVDILASVLWLIALVFRCSLFVLETQADINMMPESAARIVAGYYSGTAPTQKTRK